MNIIDWDNPKREINMLICKNDDGRTFTTVLVEDDKEAIQLFESYQVNIANQRGAFNGTETVELVSEPVY
jgi:hypothetical protein